MEALKSLAPDQKKVSDVIMSLYELAKALKIRSATKLLQAARGKVDGASLKLAAAALEGNTGKQIFTPAPRSMGRSGAEGPGTIMQADLIYFSNNARSKFSNSFALVLQDIYTRQIDTQPLKDKSSATVNAAVKKMLDTPADGTNVKITTDQGREFANLEAALPDDKLIHVTKQPNDKNAIAVVDRTIQTVKKKDIAADIADDGGYWDEKLDGATKAFNARPNSYSTVPPDDVLGNKVADFKILQKNAKFVDKQ